MEGEGADGAAPARGGGGGAALQPGAAAFQPGAGAAGGGGGRPQQPPLSTKKSKGSKLWVSGVWGRQGGGRACWRTAAPTGRVGLSELAPCS